MLVTAFSHDERAAGFSGFSAFYGADQFDAIYSAHDDSSIAAASELAQTQLRQRPYPVEALQITGYDDSELTAQELDHTNRLLCNADIKGQEPGDHLLRAFYSKAGNWLLRMADNADKLGQRHVAVVAPHYTITTLRRMAADKYHPDHSAVDSQRGARLHFSPGRLAVVRSTIELISGGDEPQAMGIAVIKTPVPPLEPAEPVQPAAPYFEQSAA